MTKKEQFNTRIPVDLKTAAVTVAARLNWTNEEIAKIALENLFGTTDQIVAEKCKLARRVVKELHLSFNAPDPRLDGLLDAA